jgi:hypothetical protein
MTCTQKCNQGRDCTCCEEVQLEPLSNWELISFYSIIVASIFFSILSLGFAAGFIYRYFS